ncbi:MAG: CHAD domain-containing protein [Burkholderiaceae bacterium]|jgi:inorganic triphosphatase YgiF|nr:CHAD domain-containing protein [Burkholderiaceae bacterium]
MAAADRTPREVELKLAVPRAALPALRRRLLRFGPATRELLQTVYFDTADRLLARHGMALRLRKAGTRWLQTLKSGGARGAFSARGEWETPAPGGRLSLARLRASPLPALLAAHGGPALLPQFSTRFTRESRLVTQGKSRIEVALDRGEVVAGTERRLPLLELELELKAGKPAALFALARQIAGEGATALALTPFSESKAARGDRLASGRPPVPLKANARAITATVSADDRLDAVLRHVVTQGAEILLANTQAMAASPAHALPDPEFVHQARVALRRMRSAIRLLRRHSPFPQTLAEELKWITGVLGAARDADVLATETLPHLAESLNATAARRLPPLVAAAESQRRTAHVALNEALASARFASLALALIAWGAAPPDDSPMLRKRAARLLDRAQRRLADSSQGFAALSPEQRHAVRILAKRLRYALDLCAVALPSQATEAYGGQLAALQDILGALNDGEVARQSIAALGADAALTRAVERRLVARERELLAEAQSALAALQAAPLPWSA